MNAFLKRIAFILLGALIIGNLLSFLSLWALRSGNFYKPSFLVNEVKVNNFDYIILGASTGLTTLNTKVIDSLTGKRGINLSMDDTNISSHFLMLQHFLSEGKTTEACVISPSVMAYASANKRISDNDYRFLPFVNEDYVFEYYKSFDQIESNLLYQSKWQPVFGISYYNVELFFPSILSLIQETKHNRFDNSGNYTYPTVKEINSKISNRERISLEFNNPYLKKIQRLCDENNIKLICYLAPLQKQAVNIIDTKYQIINHTVFLDNSIYFYDNIHVNSLGRRMVSEKFAMDFRIYLNKSQ